MVHANEFQKEKNYKSPKSPIETYRLLLVRLFEMIDLHVFRTYLMFPLRKLHVNTVSAYTCTCSIRNYLYAMYFVKCI